MAELVVWPKRLWPNRLAPPQDNRNYSAILATLQFILNMVQVWLMDNSEEDQRAQHHRVPPQYLTIDDLQKLGVLYWKVFKCAH
jgi:hypothetical protein